MIFFLVPGKPPENVVALASSTTSIRVKWNRVPRDSDIIQFKVYYETANSQNETTSMININVTEDSVEIGRLKKFVNYTVWVKSFSRRGLGVSSLPISVRTLEEGKDCLSSLVFNLSSQISFRSRETFPSLMEKTDLLISFFFFIYEHRRHLP